MGVPVDAAPVAGDWLADPAHWRRLGEQADRGGRPARQGAPVGTGDAGGRAAPAPRPARPGAGRGAGPAAAADPRRAGRGGERRRAARTGGPGRATGPRRVRRPAVPRPRGGPPRRPRPGPPGDRRRGAGRRAAAAGRQRGVAARRARRRGPGVGRAAAAVHPLARRGRRWTPPAGWRCPCWSCWTVGARPAGCPTTPGSSSPERRAATAANHFQSRSDMSSTKR